VTSATDTLDAFQTQFNVGLVTPAASPKYFEDLLSTRLLLVTARVRYFQALYGYNVALAKLKRAVAADPHARFMSGTTDEVADLADSGVGHSGGDFVR
jgi:hypothetical protein